MHTRPHLASLGRHLHRSVLRVCMPCALLRQWLLADAGIG